MGLTAKFDRRPAMTRQQRLLSIFLTVALVAYSYVLWATNSPSKSQTARVEIMKLPIPEEMHTDKQPTDEMSTKEWVEKNIPDFEPDVRTDTELYKNWMSKTVTLSRKQVASMTSREFLEVLKQHTTVFVGDRVSDKFWPQANIKNWPDRNEISFLLSQANSEEPCAKLDVHEFPTISYKFTTVGKQAVALLYAIKRGEFDIGIPQEESDSDIIEWAKRQRETAQTKPMNVLLIILSILLLYFIAAGIAFGAMYRLGRRFPNKSAARIFYPLDKLAKTSKTFSRIYNAWCKICYQIINNVTKDQNFPPPPNI